FDCIQKDVIRCSDLPKAIHQKRRTEEDGEVQAVLAVLYRCYVQKLHVGRKTLSEALEEKGIYLSEQQVRTITGRLEDRGLVAVSKGRGGTRLTPEGVQYCRKIGLE
ncbi:MAG: hypothetical protein ACI4SU_04700, partial [Anaerovoracaceae bacterium]